MYRYDEFDARIVSQRVAQFRGQVARRLSGELTEDEFKALRLQNGVYLQLHAYMLRIAIPYGQLNPPQLRCLARIARDHDRGYGHFTTRQNIQFNWMSLGDIPDVLEELAAVGMHAIQTSGNCIRNTTTDHFAGAAPDEVTDPRPWCEIIRQWSTLHPEFSALPRKFKIAVTASPEDRAAIRVHDIGLQAVRRGEELGFEVWVGGGQGRTPAIAVRINAFVPERSLLDYLEAVMRVYNRHGRRDNKYKARIKILVAELGSEEFARQVETEFAAQVPGEKIDLPREEIDRIHAYFSLPRLPVRPDISQRLEAARKADENFSLWLQTNVHPHRIAGYASVTISLKGDGQAPGDATDRQMERVADLAEQFGAGDIRVSHAQNLVLAHVALDDLPQIHAALSEVGLGTANEGRLTDMIVCPGLDYCNLANARSIPVAREIARLFSDPQLVNDIGRLHINVSGCINACGHHHVGHVGILGVDRKGEEFYQVLLGGRADERAALGRIAGPGMRAGELPAAIRRLVGFYLSSRLGPDEAFIDTLGRIGFEPFQEVLYAVD